MAEAKRLTGTVKWFSGQKGFGFVSPDDGADDLFVHQTEIRSEGFRTLRESQRVEFVVEATEDGRTKAVDVVSLPGPRRPYAGRGGGRGRERGGYGGRGRGGFGRYDEGYGRGGRRDGYGGGGGGGGGGGECYNCGQMGHLARDCYHGSGRGGGGRNRGYGGGAGGGRGGGECYNCGEEGHFARDCPNDQK